MSNTAQIGAIASLFFTSAGLIMSSLFLYAVFNKGKRFLNNTDILCLILVGFEGTYCLLVLVAISSYMIDGGVKLGLMCYVQATLGHTLAFIYVALHLALAIDRYVHTNYAKQVNIKTLLLLVVCIISLFLSLIIVALTSGNAFEVAPSGFVCTFKLTGEEENQISNRNIFGVLSALTLAIFNVTLILYTQMYFKLKIVGKDMAGDTRKRTGNEILSKLLYRCIGIMTGLSVCWTLVLVKFAYSLITNEPFPPYLDMIALLLTVIDPLIIQVTLLLMNRAYWKAISDTFLKISVKSKRFATSMRPSTVAQSNVITEDLSTETGIVSLSP